MKRIWMISAAALLAGSVACVHAQSQAPPEQDQPPAFYGRGRGGVPLAWNDLNKDGICDLTGQPVGQRPLGFGGGRGRWAIAGSVAGQATSQVPALYGRGRSGLPYAWNDRNRDGVCDLTGQPVGQRPLGFVGGQGRWGITSQAAGPVTGQVTGQAAGQATGQAAGQVSALYGRGRGGLPYAWNDLNRDGVCELTGQPVGQRPVRFGRGRGGGGRRWR